MSSGLLATRESLLAAAAAYRVEPFAGDGDGLLVCVCVCVCIVCIGIDDGRCRRTTYSQ